MNNTIKSEISGLGGRPARSPDPALLFRAKSGLKNQIGNKNPFLSNVLGPQYVKQADGSYQSNVLNMLTNSGFVGAVSGTPGTAPTGWTNFGGAGTWVVDGGSITTTAVNQRAHLGITTPSLLANTVYRFCVDAITDGVLAVGNFILASNMPTGATFTFEVDGIVRESSYLVPVGTHKVCIIISVAATAGTVGLRLGAGTSSNATGTVTISNPQLTEGATSRPYVKSPVSGPAIGDVVDVIDGRKMLRTCGAVTNLLPSGLQELSVWLASNASVLGDAFTTTAVNGFLYKATSAPIPAGTYTYSIDVLECPSGGFKIGLNNPTDGNIFSSLITQTGVFNFTFTTTVSAYTTFYLGGSGSLLSGKTVRLRNPQLTASTYPLPYTPPGTTMPASHATTTNGPWFSLPQYDDAETSDGLFKRDGVEIGDFGKDGSIYRWVFGSCTGVSENGEVKVDSGAISVFAAYPEISRIPVIPGSKIMIRWQARKGTLSVLKYSVYDQTNAVNIIAPTTYNDGVNQIEVQIPANCYNIRFYPIRDPGVAGTMYFNNISIQKLIPATKTNKVWAALDGEPDGVELVTNAADREFSSDTGWWGKGATSSISGGVVVSTNTPAWGGIIFKNGFVTGARYLIQYEVTEYTAGKVSSYSPTVAGLPRNTVGKFADIVLCTNGLLGIEAHNEAFTGKIDNISIQRIQPRPMTLAWRGVMGVGSGDLGLGVVGSVVRASESGGNPLYFERSGSDVHRVVRSTDGTNNPIAVSEWNRNAVIFRFVQVSDSGSTFRVGYIIQGIGSSITWSSWVTFGGSFRPSTLYKLLLGLGNIYPTWHDTIALWDKQIDDATLLKEMSK